jgi:hypothetical protein
VRDLLETGLDCIDTIDASNLLLLHKDWSNLLEAIRACTSFAEPPLGVAWPPPNDAVDLHALLFVFCLFAAGG